MSEELKPCPFCGGEVNLVDIGFMKQVLTDFCVSRVGVQCLSCREIYMKRSVLTTGNLEQTKNNLIEAWNKRA